MLRTKLSNWADREFGTMHPPQDKIVIYEDLAWTKTKDWIQTITLEIKKTEGIQRTWDDSKTIKRWKEEIRGLTGKYLKLTINSSFGKEHEQISGYVNDEKFVDDGTKKFNYQFKIEIQKMIKKNRGKNGFVRISRKD